MTSDLACSTPSNAISPSSPSTCASRFPRISSSSCHLYTPFAFALNNSPLYFRPTLTCSMGSTPSVLIANSIYYSHNHPFVSHSVSFLKKRCCSSPFSYSVIGSSSTKSSDSIHSNLFRNFNSDPNHRSSNSSRSSGSRDISGSSRIRHKNSSSLQCNVSGKSKRNLNNDGDTDQESSSNSSSSKTSSNSSSSKTSSKAAIQSIEEWEALDHTQKQQVLDLIKHKRGRKSALEKLILEREEEGDKLGSDQNKDKEKENIHAVSEAEDHSRQQQHRYEEQKQEEQEQESIDDDEDDEDEGYRKSNALNIKRNPPKSQDKQYSIVPSFENTMQYSQQQKPQQRSQKFSKRLAQLPSKKSKSEKQSNIIHHDIDTSYSESEIEIAYRNDDDEDDHDDEQDDDGFTTAEIRTEKSRAQSRQKQSFVKKTSYLSTTPNQPSSSKYLSHPNTKQQQQQQPQQQQQQQQQQNASPQALREYSSDEEYFIQCPFCGAVYSINLLEVQGRSKTVRCSGCSAEWVATQDSLIIGFDAASEACKLVEENNFVPDRKIRRIKDEPKKNYKDPDQSSAKNSIILFVSNLSPGCTHEDLYRCFSSYGRVLRCEIPTDYSGKIRGFAFVELSNRFYAQFAIDELQGVSIVGRPMRIKEAKSTDDFNQYDSFKSFRNLEGEDPDEESQEQEELDIEDQEDDENAKRFSQKKSSSRHRTSKAKKE